MQQIKICTVDNTSLNIALPHLENRSIIFNKDTEKLYVKYNGVAIPVGDMALQNMISTEVANRNNAIESAISEEVSDRNTAIEAAISTEVSNRNDAISSAISTEVTNRNTAIDNTVLGSLSVVNPTGTTTNQNVIIIKDSNYSLNVVPQRDGLFLTIYNSGTSSINVTGLISTTVFPSGLIKYISVGNTWKKCEIQSAVWN
jgi:metal-responsive CopG/Arc/MetJ family transcriptional regulator